MCRTLALHEDSVADQIRCIVPGGDLTLDLSAVPFLAAEAVGCLIALARKTVISLILSPGGQPLHSLTTKRLVFLTADGSWQFGWALTEAMRRPIGKPSPAALDTEE